MIVAPASLKKMAAKKRLRERRNDEEVWKLSESEEKNKWWN